VFVDHLPGLERLFAVPEVVVQGVQVERGYLEELDVIPVDEILRRPEAKIDEFQYFVCRRFLLLFQPVFLQQDPVIEFGPKGLFGRGESLDVA